MYHLPDNVYEYAHSIFQAYFSSIDEFRQFCNGLASGKDKFLYLCMIYGILIKEAETTFSPGMKIAYRLQYIDSTHKMIAWFALIEHLYSEEEFIDFYEWLRKSENRKYFPIENREKLQRIFEQDYAAHHGAIQKAVKFLKSLDPECKEILDFKFSVSNKKDQKVELSYPDKAKLLYTIRSEFVHNCQIIPEISDHIVLNLRKNKIIRAMNFSKEYLQLIFEHGLLRHFGYSGELKHPDFPYYDTSQHWGG